MALSFASFEELKTALSTLGPEEIIPALLLTPELAVDILAHDPVNRKVRAGNIAKLMREIQGGHWDQRKSPPLRFLPTLRMSDGQHRCLSVAKTGIAIVVSACIVPDTVGIDEGAQRTLVDHLQLSHGLDAERATLASVVTKALCHVANAGNRDYLEFYKQHEEFIGECVEKPIAWLEDQAPSVAVVFKPAVLATLRARAIAEKQEPAESVDQLLSDAINGGATAPEGSPRRALAKQFFDSMQEAFTSKKKTKQADILKWLRAALYFEREQTVKNIMTARLPSEKKSNTERQRRFRKRHNQLLVELDVSSKRRGGRERRDRSVGRGPGDGGGIHTRRRTTAITLSEVRHPTSPTGCGLLQGVQRDSTKRSASSTEKPAAMCRVWRSVAT